MPPLNNLNFWTDRISDKGEPLEPKWVCTVICEGENTEAWYFGALLPLLNKKGLPKYVSLQYCERTGEDKSSSHPTRLLSFAKQIKSEDSFGPKDKIAIVFDADVYKGKSEEYKELLEECRTEGVIPCVTYPSFELFLLLHIKDAIDKYIAPNEEKLFQNKREGSKHRRCFIERLLSKVTDMNVKRNPKIGLLASNYSLAITEEKRINQDINSALTALTSNIGAFLEEITAQ